MLQGHGVFVAILSRPPHTFRRAIIQRMSEAVPANASGKDSETFYTALVTNGAVLAIELIAFVFLKHRLGRIYQPRAYLPPPQKRAVDLPRGAWRWLLAVFAVPTADVLEKNGLDAYMFLRFLRLLVILFASITVLTWLVILPVDSAGIHDPVFTDSLARLSWGNIPPDATPRYAAHIIVVYITTFWTIFLMRKELAHFATVRQAFLMSRAHSRLAQARTVLITNVPDELCDEKELTRWASFVPGGVQNVWIYRDTTDLNEDYKDRLKLCKKLEKATSKLVRSVIKARNKHDAAEAKAQKRAEQDRQKQAHADEKAGRTEEKTRHESGDLEDEAQNSGVRPSADGTVVAAEEPEMKGKVSYEESVSSPHNEMTMGREDVSPSSRPHRSRTITSELGKVKKPHSTAQPAA
ncbi:hypothetical protein EIP86_006083 [Pleurotus ostreatoroseus]|nr:hypothetical protein EIP86_006083 [Pleurotus ostreatoroseus]